MPGDPSDPPYGRFINSVFSIIDRPVTIFREKVVEPIQSKNKQYYYHRRFRRVPNIDECEVGDEVCIWEANEQYKRDKMVDAEIVKILRQRRIECEIFHGRTDAPQKCAKLVEDYEDASTNYFIRYGDMGPVANAREAYMKQKHRMVWERRHGPVGSAAQTEEAH